MPSLRSIVTRALSDINAVELGEAAPADAAADALERLQQMMAGWEADGLVLHTISPDDGETIPFRVPERDFALEEPWPLARAHVEGVTAMLACKLAPSYGHQITQKQAGAAQMGRRRLNADFYPEPTLRADTALLRTSSGSRYGYFDIGVTE